MLAQHPGVIASVQNNFVNIISNLLTQNYLTQNEATYYIREFQSDPMNKAVQILSEQPFLYPPHQVDDNWLVQTISTYITNMAADQRNQPPTNTNQYYSSGMVTAPQIQDSGRSYGGREPVHHQMGTPTPVPGSQTYVTTQPDPIKQIHPSEPIILSNEYSAELNIPDIVVDDAVSYGNDLIGRIGDVSLVRKAVGSEHVLWATCNNIVPVTDISVIWNRFNANRKRLGLSSGGLCLTVKARELTVLPVSKESADEFLPKLLLQHKEVIDAEFGDAKRVALINFFRKLENHVNDSMKSSEAKAVVEFILSTINLYVANGGFWNTEFIKLYRGWTAKNLTSVVKLLETPPQAWKPIADSDSFQHRIVHIVENITQAFRKRVTVPVIEVKDGDAVSVDEVTPETSVSFDIITQLSEVYTNNGVRVGDYSCSVEKRAEIVKFINEESVVVGVNRDYFLTDMASEVWADELTAQYPETKLPYVSLDDASAKSATDALIKYYAHESNSQQPVVVRSMNARFRDLVIINSIDGGKFLGFART